MQAKPAQSCDDLKKLIREVPDFPKPGILFYDITTLLKDRLGFARLIDALTEHHINDDIDLVLGIEARGFIFGPALAYRLNAGFVPVRKPKKLPAEVLQWKYDLEYGQDTLEIHKDAIQPGQRILICDDLLATGGTAKAAAAMVESLGGKICGMGFVVELDGLKGRDKLKSYDVFSLLHYEM
jgi:adenine phosphoribosyltransferase